MILSFRHKGLKLFFETGNLKGIQAKHAAKLRLILTLLDVAETPEDINFAGAERHLLIPHSDGIYAVKVSGNWRVTFRMNGKNVEIVDYLDYH